MLSYIKTYRLPLLFATFSCVLYWVFAYDLMRSDFTKLISLYGVLFFLAYTLISTYGWNFKLLAAIGIAFRLILLFAIPNLSQDFYRFIWDGNLMLQGVNPYLFTPEMYMVGTADVSGVSIPNAGKLVEGMGELNAGHFSNYPPVNQFFFMLAVLFSGKSILGTVIAMRMFMILADVGILYFGRKLLKAIDLPEKRIFWYFINPFIILELTGNLHFEGVMLFFLIWAIYLLHQGKWLWAAFLVGLSISVKLIPLMLLPLFYKYLTNTFFFGKGFWKMKKFYWIVIGSVLLCFTPFLSAEFISNFAKTIGLWFQDFEFNASVFYIIRWIGFQTVGWDPIETAGKVLPLIVIVFILFLSFFRRNQSTRQLVLRSLFAVSFYLLLSTTVHPWYVVTPLILSLFTRFNFAIVWSLVVMMSYSAYSENGFDENLWLVALEYFIAIGYALWEILYKKNKQLPI